MTNERVKELKEKVFSEVIIEFDSLKKEILAAAKANPKLHQYLKKRKLQFSNDELGVISPYDWIDWIYDFTFKMGNNKPKEVDATSQEQEALLKELNRKNAGLNEFSEELKIKRENQNKEFIKFRNNNINYIKVKEDIEKHKKAIERSTKNKTPPSTIFKMRTNLKKLEETLKIVEIGTLQDFNSEIFVTSSKREKARQRVIEIQFEKAEEERAKKEAKEKEEAFKHANSLLQKAAELKKPKKPKKTYNSIFDIVD